MADVAATPLLLSIGAAAAYVGLPRRSYERAQAAGRIGPEPIRLGTRRMYRSADLAEWVRLGCPDREAWRATRAAEVASR